MDNNEKQEYEEAAKFMQMAARHIDKASSVQKLTLLKLLLANPPEGYAMQAAEHIWSGLTEKEFMTLCAKLQKQHDKEFWQFATRWR